MADFEKYSRAERTFYVKWTGILPFGSTIVNAAWTVPEGLDVKQAWYTDDTTYIRIAGGTAGRLYVLGVRVLTSDGDTEDQSVTLMVLPHARGIANWDGSVLRPPDNRDIFAGLFWQQFHDTDAIEELPMVHFCEGGPAITPPTIFPFVNLSMSAELALAPVVNLSMSATVATMPIVNLSMTASTS